MKRVIKLKQGQSINCVFELILNEFWNYKEVKVTVEATHKPVRK